LTPFIVFVMEVCAVHCAINDLYNFVDG